MDAEHEAAAAFAAAARRYVAVVEGAWKPEPELLLGDLAAVLPALYGAALRLPDVAGKADELPDGMRLTAQRWKDVFDRLQEALPGDDYYWTVEPSIQEDPVELTGSLADDLADIYGDVKPGLDLLAAGGSMSAAAWEWRFSFWSHWGTHAVEALRIVHGRLAPDGASP